MPEDFEAQMDAMVNALIDQIIRSAPIVDLVEMSERINKELERRRYE